MVMWLRDHVAELYADASRRVAAAAKDEDMALIKSNLKNLDLFLKSKL